MSCPSGEIIQGLKVPMVTSSHMSCARFPIWWSTTLSVSSSVAMKSRISSTTSQPRGCHSSGPTVHWYCLSNVSSTWQATHLWVLWLRISCWHKLWNHPWMAFEWPTFEWWFSNLGLNSCLKRQANVGTKTVTILTWAPAAVSQLDAPSCLRSMGTRKKQIWYHSTNVYFTAWFMLRFSLLKIAPSPWASLSKEVRRTGTVWTRIHLAQENWSPQKKHWLSFGELPQPNVHFPWAPQPLQSFALPPAVKKSKTYWLVWHYDQHYKWHDPHFIPTNKLPSWSLIILIENNR